MKKIFLVNKVRLTKVGNNDVKNKQNWKTATEFEKLKKNSVWKRNVLYTVTRFVYSCTVLSNPNKLSTYQEETRMVTKIYQLYISMWLENSSHAVLGAVFIRNKECIQIQGWYTVVLYLSNPNKLSTYQEETHMVTKIYQLYIWIWLENSSHSVFGAVLFCSYLQQNGVLANMFKIMGKKSSYKYIICISQSIIYNSSWNQSKAIKKLKTTKVSWTK